MLTFQQEEQIMVYLADSNAPVITCESKSYIGSVFGNFIIMAEN